MKVGEVWRNKEGAFVTFTGTKKPEIIGYTITLTKNLCYDKVMKCDVWLVDSMYDDGIKTTDIKYDSKDILDRFYKVSE